MNGLDDFVMLMDIEKGMYQSLLVKKHSTATSTLTGTDAQILHKGYIYGMCALLECVSIDT